MIILSIRWKVIFEWYCALTDHVWKPVQALTPFDWSGRLCSRCRRFERRHGHYEVIPAGDAKRVEWVNEGMKADPFVMLEVRR